MPYIVQTASAQMPTSVRSPYRRVAVLKVAPGVERATMISDRARDVIAVIETWERLHAGGRAGANNAYSRALREAEALALTLNTRELGVPV